MTRQAFLSKVSSKISLKNSKKDEFLKLCSTYPDVDWDFLHNFLYNDGFHGQLSFYREDDGIVIRIEGYGVCFWEDIGQYVGEIAHIRIPNCFGGSVIEKFYLSKEGYIWDEHHKLRFQTEDRLFDYLCMVKIDYHITIPKNIYEILGQCGWYEGRHVDTTDFEREMGKKGIKLSQTQRNIISEFSGLYLTCAERGFYLKFYSLEEMLEDERLCFETEVYKYDEFHNADRIIGKNVLEIGTEVRYPFSISENGKVLYSNSDTVLARNVLEYIYGYHKFFYITRSYIGDHVSEIVRSRIKGMGKGENK